MNYMTRFSTTMVLLAIMLTGCSDTLLTEHPERSMRDDAALEEAEVSLQASTIRGEISGYIVEEVSEGRYGPDRKIEVTASFEVQTDERGNVDGKFAYEDATGTRFTALIRELRTINARTVVFAGPLMVNAARNPRWVYVQVSDGGSPGAGNDRLTYQIDGPLSEETRNLPNEASEYVFIERGDIFIEEGTGKDR